MIFQCWSYDWRNKMWWDSRRGWGVRATWAQVTHKELRKVTSLGHFVLKMWNLYTIALSAWWVFDIVRRIRRRKGVCGRLSPRSRWDPSIPTPTHQPHTSVLFPKPCNYPIYKYSLCQREGKLRQEDLTLRWASPDLFPCQFPASPLSSSSLLPTTPSMSNSSWTDARLAQQLPLCCILEGIP